MGEAVLNGVRLSYEIAGDGDPVVLVAGTGMSGSGWELLGAPELRAAGYRTITFDNRGVGSSDGPPGPYSVADMAADTAALIEHLGYPRTRVIGISLGGSIAQELTRTRPDLVQATVLWAGAGRVPAFFRRLSAAALEIASVVALPASWHLVELLLISLPFETLQSDDDQVEAVAALVEASLAWSGDGCAGQLSANVEWDFVDHADLYRQINCPCLVIAHQLDLIFPPHAGRAAAAAMPRGSFLEIDNVTHGQALQAASTVLPAIIEFFATIDT